MKAAGKLNSDQFALAMHLVQQKLKGIDPPAALSPEMIPPSLRTFTFPVCRVSFSLQTCAPLYTVPAKFAYRWGLAISEDVGSSGRFCIDSGVCCEVAFPLWQELNPVNPINLASDSTLAGTGN